MNKKTILLPLLFALFLSMASAFTQQIAAAGEKWNLDYEAASKTAKAEHKPILMVFGGSDWCKPCIMLRKEVWESEAFKRYAADNLVLVELDFPRLKKNQLPAEQVQQNEALAARYNKQGVFPLVVLTDEYGKVLATTGYQAGGPEKYIEHLNTLLQH
ncbi:thioredoxin family protein [Pontibacter sp. E15-1]|uniref:thioredoxin family protein n=1 Tax=Pontibacter sp. E15-1 TaxID=2919918 RepID=UPI001F4F469D|nr:thioredoxin family protein [Pontibacter sp. E15-1]MCJ8166776.1 thioredoxin family protein [Pontibacter sp. E15-1]